MCTSFVKPLPLVTDACTTAYMHSCTPLHAGIALAVVVSAAGVVVVVVVVDDLVRPLTRGASGGLERLCGEPVECCGQGEGSNCEFVEGVSGQAGELLHSLSTRFAVKAPQMGLSSRATNGMIFGRSTRAEPLPMATRGKYASAARRTSCPSPSRRPRAMIWTVASVNGTATTGSSRNAFFTCNRGKRSEWAGRWEEHGAGDAPSRRRCPLRT